MDPITLSVSIFTILKVLNHIVEAAKRLNKSGLGFTDARLRDQLLSFKLEKLALETWLKNSAIASAPAHQREEIERTLSDFGRESLRIDNKFFDHTSRAEGPISLGADILPRIDYHSGDYEDLEKKLSRLKDLNTKLQTMAPPLPPAYDFDADANSRDESVWSIARRTSGIRFTTVAQPMVYTQNDNEPLAASTNLQDPLQDLHSLWKMTTSAANIMARFAKSDGDSFQTVYERLKIWGSGLFGDVLDLDTITARTKGLQSRLAEPLAAQLVDIAMEQESIMRVWIPTSSERGHRELRSAAFALHHFLVTTEMTEALVEEVMYQSIDNRRPQNTSGFSYQSDSDSSDLEVMVNILFDYLPAINRLRRAEILKIEQKTTLLAMKEPQSIAVSLSEGLRAKSFQSGDVGPVVTEITTAAQLIDNNLGKVQKFEEQLYSSTTNDQTTQSLLKLFSKERQRLAECKRSLESGEARFTSPQGQLEVGKMQRQFATLLDASFPDIVGVAQTPERYLSAEQEKRVRAIIDSMQSATSHLYGETINNEPPQDNYEADQLLAEARTTSWNIFQVPEIRPNTS